MKLNLTLAFLLVAVLAGAQSYQVQSVGLATNNIAVSATATLNAVMDASASTVPVQIQFKLTGAGTENQTFVFQRSLDRTNWLTYTTVAVAANGTSTVTTVTNLDAGNLGWIRLATWQNASATAVATNLAVAYALKF